MEPAVFIGYVESILHTDQPQKPVMYLSIKSKQDVLKKMAIGIFNLYHNVEYAALDAKTFDTLPESQKHGLKTLEDYLEFATNIEKQKGFFNYKFEYSYVNYHVDQYTSEGELIPSTFTFSC